MASSSPEFSEWRLCDPSRSCEWLHSLSGTLALSLLNHTKQTIKNTLLLNSQILFQLFSCFGNCVYMCKHIGDTDLWTTENSNVLRKIWRHLTWKIIMICANIVWRKIFERHRPKWRLKKISAKDIGCCTNNRELFLHHPIKSSLPLRLVATP